MFLADEVTYLEHRINKYGRQPTEDKVQAIKKLPEPRKIKELQAFLVMLNYYGCYLPKLSTVLAPLHELLGKDIPWSLHGFLAVKGYARSERPFELVILTCLF